MPQTAALLALRLLAKIWHHPALLMPLIVCIATITSAWLHPPTPLVAQSCFIAFLALDGHLYAKRGGLWLDQFTYTTRAWCGITILAVAVGLHPLFSSFWNLAWVYLLAVLIYHYDPYPSPRSTTAPSSSRDPDIHRPTVAIQV